MIPDEPVWGQVLGAHRDGRSRETGLNLDWAKAKPKVVWRAPIGGGFSSVAVVSPMLYTQVNRGDRDGVLALDANTRPATRPAGCSIGACPARRWWKTTW
jgi:hypothetical protein